MENIKSFMTNRQYMYMVLAAIYRGDLEKVIQVYDEITIFRDALIKNDYSVDIKDEIKNNIETLAEEYNSLFFGPSNILAPLWGSVYESDDRLLFGESELKVRRFYRKFGLDVSEKYAADHLAFQLAFMSRMCSNLDYENIEHINKNILSQMDFLKNYILNWISKWNEDVIKNSKTFFWKYICGFTVAWLYDDLNELDKLI